MREGRKKDSAEGREVVHIMLRKKRAPKSPGPFFLNDLQDLFFMRGTVFGFS